MNSIAHFNLNAPPIKAMPSQLSFGACCCGKDADIQMIVGMLRRVGLGPFSSLVGAPSPTGPLTGDIYDGAGIPNDPLYLILTNTLAWADGTTFKETITYDPKFGDYTWEVDGPSMWAGYIGGAIQIPFVQKNLVATGLPTQFVIGPSLSPPQKDPQHIYDGGNNPTNTMSADGLCYTNSGSTYIDDNGVTHWGYAFASVLSSPFTFEQYAQIADQICLNNGATLQDGTLNPDKAYDVGPPGDTRKTKLRYLCEFPNPAPIIPAYTNILVVTQIRGADGITPVYQYWPSTGLSYDQGDWDYFFLSDDTGHILGQLPCSGGGYGASISTQKSILNGIWSQAGPPARYPLAAHGMTFIANLPGAPAFSAPYIASVQSSVRAMVDMSGTAAALIYNPGSDSYNIGPGKVPIGAGEYILEPGAVRGLGMLVALYSAEAFCTTMLQPLPGWLPVWGEFYMPQGGTQGTVKYGHSITLYAGTFDKNGQWMRNRSGKWSLQLDPSVSGTITQDCLKPAPDGLSAVFTAPASGSAQSQALIRVDIDGLTFIPGVLVIAG